MCGIAGITSGNLGIVRKMLQVMKHRGSEGTYFYSDANYLSTGMHRLAIQDQSPALYPFKYKQFVLFFNGEIYNHHELFTKYLKGKIDRKTSCDAEVILPLFVLFGMKCFRLFDGMFAISIYDTQKKRLYLARDRFGEKPLFYQIKNGVLSFGSELRSLLQIPGTSKELAVSAIPDYLITGSTTSDTTLVKGIKKLIPGSCLAFDIELGKSVVQKYWSLEQEIQNSRCCVTNSSTFVQILDTILHNSVKKRISDNSAHIFLSGGIDSSLLAYYSTQSTKNVSTYSVGFSNSFFHDESSYSAKVAKYLATDHHHFNMDSSDLLKLVLDIETYIDHPFSDPAFLPSLVLAKNVRYYTKVAFAGEGADELFAGYPRYREAFFSPLLNQNSRYVPQQIWKSSELELLGFSTLDEKTTSLELAMSKQIHDMHTYLPNQLLAKADNASMAYNLEVRSPFLANKVVSFALQLPESEKIRYGITKVLLRKLAWKHLPKLISIRPKHGFSVPLEDVLREKSFVTAFKSLVEDSSIFEKKHVLKVFSDHQLKFENNKHKIWSMFVLLSWAKKNGIKF